MEIFDLWSQLAALGQVIAIDLVLAGDNAIVVGMAAAGVPVVEQRKVIFWGVGAAIALRIFFALITTQLLAIIGLTLAGGVLLLVRSRWAVWATGLSFIGAVLGLGWQLGAAPPLAGAEGPMFDVMPVVIILVALGLFLYARAMEKKGVLR